MMNVWDRSWDTLPQFSTDFKIPKLNSVSKNTCSSGAKERTSFKTSGTPKPDRHHVLKTDSPSKYRINSSIMKASTKMRSSTESDRNRVLSNNKLSGSSIVPPIKSLTMMKRYDSSPGNMTTHTTYPRPTIHRQTVKTSKSFSEVPKSASMQKSKNEKLVSSILTPENIKKIKRGTAPLHLIEMYNNPKEEIEFRKLLAQFPGKRQRLPPITPKEKETIDWVKNQCMWPRGNRDLQIIADYTDIDFHKVRYQFRNDERWQETQTDPKNRREPLSKEEKDRVFEALETKDPRFEGSVDRYIFNKVYGGVRRDQFDYLVRQNY